MNAPDRSVLVFIVISALQHSSHVDIAVGKGPCVPKSEGRQHKFQIPFIPKDLLEQQP